MARMSALSRVAARLVPSPLKRGLRQLGVQDALRARRLAGASKRLDWCALQLATLLHLAGLAGKAPLRGKHCVEVGAGWVLSHSVAMHLLGAQRVDAVDIAHVAKPRWLARAIRRSNLDLLPGGILGFFDDRNDVRHRLERLRRIPRFSFEALASLGIHYQAPLDLATGPFTPPVDFLFSTCVLEYVPPALASRFAANLVASLVPGGFMIHYIHLEDHAFLAGRPLAFLSEPGERFERSGAAQTRGNRLRASTWERLFKTVPGTEVRVLYAGRCERGALPAQIDPALEHAGEDDLLVGHLGILVRRV